MSISLKFKEPQKGPPPSPMISAFFPSPPQLLRPTPEPSLSLGTASGAWRHRVLLWLGLEGREPCPHPAGGAGGQWEEA